MRYCLELSYDGTNYHGWQVQQNAHSVQAEINHALGLLCGKEVETVGCGRTDTGVHAKQFFLHFDSEKDFDKGLLSKMNSILPNDIAVYAVRKVADDFHARFDAIQRSYSYFITRRKDPFSIDRAWQYYVPLDIAAMQTGADIIREYTDFGAFSKTHTQVFTNNCRIDEARWEEQEHQLIFHISADRFLRNMVRAIVGTLVEMGKGKLDEAGLRKIIEGKDRSEAGVSVPACGLYLVGVKYPAGKGF